MTPDEIVNGAVDTVDLRLCRELAQLEYEKTVLEEDLKIVEEKIGRLWARLYPMLVGRKSQPLEDGVRLQPKRSLLCTKRGGVDTREAVQALRQCDLGWLVREDYSISGLKEHLALVEDERRQNRDTPEDINDLLPEILRPLFQVIEKNAVVVYGVKSRAKEAVAKKNRERSAIG